MKNYLWTEDGGRLQFQSTSSNSQLNWIFLPGGPGLGSEAFSGLTNLLKNKIPGTIWHFDLPNDGSNILDDKPLSNWRSALLQAIDAFPHVILVAHSTPGMYVQTLPELEEKLAGLVLIGSAPDASWQEQFEAYRQIHIDDRIAAAEHAYATKPNDKSLRQLLIAASKFCFTTPESIHEGNKLFKRLPINNAASEWSSKHFDQAVYQATWIPRELPTLITTGAKDPITPIELYKKNNHYHRKNIIVDAITGAGHYPWFENPNEMLALFKQFSKLVLKEKT